MVRAALILALLWACYLPLDPYAGHVSASVAFQIAPVPADTVMVWGWQLADTLRLHAGDGTCTHFLAPANAPSVWSFRSAQVPQHDLVWWTPTRAWPHITIRIAGTDVTYLPETQTC